MNEKRASHPEYGDFQTPIALAQQICKLLVGRGVNPRSVLEPTCGTGGFLLTALENFPHVSTVLGIDINRAHVDTTRDRLALCACSAAMNVLHASFFDVDWPIVLSGLPEPILVVGNPPWVTNSALGALTSSNLPIKSNFQNHRGLEALTGKSNFDISEWMLIKLLSVLSGRRATLAMLCKTTVARKVLAHAWKNDISLCDAEIHPIDAARYFGAAVDACLLVCSLSPASRSRECLVYRDFRDDSSATTIGYYDNQLVADVSAYERSKHLQGEGKHKWRSGIKHDCAKVMELRREGCLLRNGFGELVDLEDDYLFPLLKGSELRGGCSREPTRWMLVTQKAVGDPTSVIRSAAPKTWQYLMAHQEHLDRRASSIYRSRARFCVFGVGSYTFAPWKVCISGFYKRLAFAVIGPYRGKPIVVDDTSYFLPCESEGEAKCLVDLLNSHPARDFFSAFVFWDAKRPITIDLLRRLNLSALAQDRGGVVDMPRR
jgi:hypothetical protein